jgi:hypothetical protein
MHLAFCSDTASFSQDQLRNQQWSSKFPGAGWITCLYDLADESGIQVASGDVAIGKIKSNKWRVDDVYVIQEMQSVEATKLLNMGAKAFLITCAEAPLYAPFFFDHICRLSKSFQFTMGFGFSLARCGNLAIKKDLPFRFPSYFLSDIQEITKWQDRKKIVLVAANKYKTQKLCIPDLPSAINLMRQIKALTWRLISPSYRKSLEASLHDKRLEMVEYFSKNGELALYGAGWDKWDTHPSAVVCRLKNSVKKQYLGLCQNKHETISRYKFSICFENMALAGYVTEKIVDCFVAGTIPLYWGAPDISSIVPEQAFVDLRKFSSLVQLDAYLNSMSEEQALAIIGAGRSYLQSEAGMLHCYETFARTVITVAKTC